MALHEWRLTFGDQDYPFLWGEDCLDGAIERLRAMDGDLYILVTDPTVDALHGRSLREALQPYRPVLTLVVDPPGEAGKTLETLSRFADRAFAAGATRRSVVVTVGGGVPGNVGGLLAAMLFRGIRLVHIPTTLIGMFDSVVSLKQAVNTPRGKNLLGAYYRPEMVLADVAMLATLPPSQVRSGLCEVIKNALAIDPAAIPDLEARLSPDCRLSREDAVWLLEFSLRSKARVMEDDPRERSRGVVLEYGHTVGHAIELAHNQLCPGAGISHGEAVAVGMLVAAEVAARLGLLPPDAVATHYRLVERIGAHKTLPSGVAPQRVLELVHFDNKRGYRSLDSTHVAMILLRDLGSPAEQAAQPLTAVPRTLLAAVVEDFAAHREDIEEALG